jgi:cadmium resistance protein CadD (predicted permease)
MVLILLIACICGGILLGITALDKLDGESDFFNNIAKKLMPFTTLIGGIVIALGIFELLKIFGFTYRRFLFDLIAIASGLLLLTHVLSQVPSIGDALVKASKALMPFKVILGLALFALSILRLLGIY